MCYHYFICQHCFVFLSFFFLCGFLVVVFFPKACLLFGRPQTSSLKIHACVGISFIGWFNDYLIFYGVFHCQTCLEMSTAMTFPSWGFGCCLLSQSLPNFWRPQTSSLGINTYVGISFIGWFNCYWYCYWYWYCQPLVFGCWLLNQGLHLHPFWKALNIDPKHISLYGSKLYWVSQSLTYVVTWFYTARHV